jgi:hypothetical protein
MKKLSTNEAIQKAAEEHAIDWARKEHSGQLTKDAAIMAIGKALQDDAGSQAAEDTAQAGGSTPDGDPGPSWSNLKVRVRVTANDTTKLADTALDGHPLDMIKTVLDAIGPDFVLDALSRGGIHLSAFIED